MSIRTTTSKMGSMSLSSSKIHAELQPAEKRKHESAAPFKVISSRASLPHLTLKSLENAMIDRVTLHVANLAKATFYIRRHDCFYRRGSHMGLSALVKTLVRELNIRLGDYNGWESTGVRCAMLAVEYMNRASPCVVIHYVQSFFATAFMLAFKLNDDESLPNSFFSNLSGFNLNDLNAMEVEFCDIIKWNLGISLQSYIHLRNMLLPI